MHGETLK